MSWDEHHRDSERLAIEAELALKSSDSNSARDLYRQAAEAEYRALSEIGPNKPRTLAITVVSVVSLYYKAGKIQKAQAIAEEWLKKGDLLPFAEGQIKEILKVISNKEKISYNGKILFLPANPVNVASRLQVDLELREISNRIHMGTYGSQLELVSEWAIRAGDLQAALLRHQPDIVHFSGHGSQASGIVVEDENGNSKNISRKALSDLFSILKGNIRVVVLNACYAKDQAQALTTTIDSTIGMNDAIEDRAAIIFAAHFYQSLAFGCSVEEAFQLARNQLEIEGIAGAQIPEMLVRDGANPAEIRIGQPSLSLAKPKSKATVSRELSVSASIVEAIMGGLPGGKLERRHRRAAFFSWLFASVAIILITDVVRRFLSSDSGWLNNAASIIQVVFTLFGTLALLLIGISLLRLANPLVEKAARADNFNESRQARRAVVVTGIALVIAFGLWLSYPIFAHYYNERGVRLQYAEQPDLSRARESYHQALRLKPSYAQAHYNLAVAEEDLRPEKAIEEYLLTIRYDSRIYPAYNNLARLYLLRGASGDYEQALNLLNQAVDLSPPDESVQYSLHKNLGWANSLLKHYTVAETHLRRAISLRREGAAAHCLLAYVLKEQGKAGVPDECFDCVSLAPGEKNIEAAWVSDAQDCLMKGGLPSTTVSLPPTDITNGSCGRIMSIEPKESNGALRIWAEKGIAPVAATEGMLVNNGSLLILDPTARAVIICADGHMYTLAPGLQGCPCRSRSMP
jgi:tetratricopeptide (TPR) repeat protein